MRDWIYFIATLVHPYKIRDKSSKSLGGKCAEGLANRVSETTNRDQSLLIEGMQFRPTLISPARPLLQSYQ